MSAVDNNGQFSTQNMEWNSKHELKYALQKQKAKS